MAYNQFDHAVVVDKNNAFDTELSEDGSLEGFVNSETMEDKVKSVERHHQAYLLALNIERITADRLLVLYTIVFYLDATMQLLDAPKNVI